MPKITAIHGGGDWYDASADYLVLPEGMDIEAEAIKRKAWYEEVYLKSLRDEESGVRYLTLYDWLKQNGARDPLPDELSVFDVTQ